MNIFLIIIIIVLLLIVCAFGVLVWLLYSDNAFAKKRVTKIKKKVTTINTKIINKRNFIGRYVTRKILFPIIYFFLSKKPVKDNKVVFVETKYNEITPSFQNIFNKLVKEYDLELHSHFFKDGKITKKEALVRYYDFIRDSADAKYIIENDGSDIFPITGKRKETKVLNTWHGCGAFKKFGYSTRELVFGDTPKNMDRFPSYGKIDLFTVSSDEVRWAYAEAMNKKDNDSFIKATGVSRTDVFFDKEFIEKAFEHLYSIMPSAKDKKIILYSPTFRGRVKTAIMPDMLDVRMFMDNFKDEYVLITKHHPLVKNRPKIPAECSDFARDLTNSMSIEELLCISDICISDYSSLIFEYSLFERPMLFYAFDLDDYDDWRGFYYSYDEFTPGPICTNNEEMIDYIKNIDERFDVEKVKAFKEKFMGACDGNSTQRIMKELFGGDIEKYRREKPLEGIYDYLPDSKITMHHKEKVLRKSLAKKDELTRIYIKECENEVNNNFVTFLDTDKTNLFLKNNIKKSFSDFDIKFATDYTSDEELVKRIARSKFVLAITNHEILKYIQLRNETKLIHLGDCVIPIDVKDEISKNVISNIEAESIKKLPFINKYDAILTSSDNNDGTYETAYSLKEDCVLLPYGNCWSDLVLDVNYLRNAKLRITQLIPTLREKETIVFMLTRREGLKDNLNSLISSMLETFKDRFAYVIVYSGSTPNFTDKSMLIEIESDLVFEDNKSTIHKTYADVFSVADIVIGDYGTQILASTLLDKPLLLWEYDCNSYNEKRDISRTEAEMFKDVVKNNEQLIEKIQNNDYGSSKEFKEKYLNACDGNALKKANKWMHDLVN